MLARSTLRRSLCLALLFAAVMLVCVPATAQQAQRTGVVVGLSGQATLMNPGKSPVPAMIGSEVEVGTLVRTGPEGRVKLYFERDVVVTCGPSSSLEISSSLLAPDGSDSPGVFRLLFGTIRVLVGKVFGVQRQLDVETPNGVAGVTGTTFIVRVQPDDRSLFLTLDGALRVSGSDAQATSVALVAPNYTYVVAGTAPIDPQPAPRELWDDLLDSTELECRPEQSAADSQRPAGALPSLSQMAQPGLSLEGRDEGEDASGAGDDEVWIETQVPADSTGDDGENGSENEGDVDVVVEFPE
ncbi:MAG: FecR domain-containing protein [Candidatus Alcyoniella australis]|nr:FecR domain-containing protein [Candidatus Alcyoniella australis]